MLSRLHIFYLLKSVIGFEMHKRIGMESSGLFFQLRMYLYLLIIVDI